MSWIAYLIQGLGWLAKIIFGTDKPQKVVIDENPLPNAVRKSDDELLNELRRNVGASDGKARRNSETRDANANTGEQDFEGHGRGASD